MTTILVSSVDEPFGRRVARVLGAHKQVRLLGMAHTEPATPTGCVEIRVPPLEGYALADWLRARRVDGVIYLTVPGEGQAAPDSDTAIQQHVIATMKLLGACAAAGVRRVVLRSSTLVYGARPGNPAFIAEQHPLARRRLTGLLQNYIDVERFAAEFGGQHPGITIVVLRCAGLVGADVWSPLAHYLRQPEPRMLLGFNPRIQLLHPDDAARAFALAARRTASGAFNLAASEPLTLAQAIRLAGQQPAPLPDMLFSVADWFGQRRTLLGAWPFALDFLRHACVADTGRARRELGWQPTHTANGILRELSPVRRIRPQQQPDMAAAEASRPPGNQYG